MNFYVNMTLFIIEVVAEMVNTYNNFEVIDLLIKSLK